MGLFSKQQYSISIDSSKKKTGPTKVEYMCSYCGQRQTMKIGFGRPNPGTCHRRKSNQPHRWVINRKY